MNDTQENAKIILSNDIAMESLQITRILEQMLKMSKEPDPPYKQVDTVFGMELVNNQLKEFWIKLNTIHLQMYKFYYKED